jgi:glycosyltransferase involved in cell wall biosynthesis
MDFTFGIITNKGEHLGEVINSILNLNIPNFEIIIVGELEEDIHHEKIKLIIFKDYSIHFNISVKKNIITEESKYENIVYLHDYVSICVDWYTGFLEFGGNFDICMTRMVNIDGSRYRDWCLWQDDANKYVGNLNYLIPYDMSHLSSMMYISGAYWVAKKSFMINNKLNENLSWGQGEDVEWSLRVRNKTEFKMNTLSSVKLLKNKNRIFNETNNVENNILYNIKYYDNTNSYNELVKNHLGKWIR